MYICINIHAHTLLKIAPSTVSNNRMTVTMVRPFSNENGTSSVSIHCVLGFFLKLRNAWLLNPPDDTYVGARVAGTGQMRSARFPHTTPTIPVMLRRPNSGVLETRTA